MHYVLIYCTTDACKMYVLSGNVLENNKFVQNLYANFLYCIAWWPDYVIRKIGLGVNSFNVGSGHLFVERLLFGQTY